MKNLTTQITVRLNRRDNLWLKHYAEAKQMYMTEVIRQLVVDLRDDATKGHLVEKQEDNRYRDVLEALQKIDARLSWIEGQLADAESMILIKE